MKNEYYIARGEQTEGPFTIRDLARMRATGQIYDSTFCTIPGAENWLTIADVMKLRNVRRLQIAMKIAAFTILIGYAIFSYVRTTTDLEDFGDRIEALSK